MQDKQQMLETAMNEFVTASMKRYGGYAYPVGYLMSMIQLVAIENPKIADRLIRNFNISLEDYK